MEKFILSKKGIQLIGNDWFLGVPRSFGTEYRIYKGQDGEQYISLLGQTTANGIQTWLYNLKRFEIKDGKVVLPEETDGPFNPDHKIYNNQIVEED